MVDEQAPEAGEETQGEEQTPDQIREDRRAAKDRARRERLQEENQALKARLAEIDERERLAEEEKLRAKGDFDKLDAERQTKIRDLTEKLEAANATIEQGKVDKRRGKFLDAVMKAGGITNRKVAAALIVGLDIDSAPENFTAKDARDAAKLLKEDAPEIFGGGTTDPKPPPGSGKKPLDQSSDEYWKGVGRAYSTNATNSPYNIATGRAQKE